MLILPIGLNILKMIPSSQWWGTFSYTNILFMFSDYFSPILTNNVNAPNVFFYNKNLVFLTLMTLPTIIAFYLIIVGARRAKGLAVIALGVILLTALLAFSGKIVFITKYTIEILPILILLLSLGVKGKVEKALLIIFVLIQLIAVFTPYYPSKIFRAEGHKLVADILNDKKLDRIVFTYYEPNRFFRYLKNDANMDSISKSNRFWYLENLDKVLSSAKQSERVSVVFLNSVSFIPYNSIEIAKENKVPEMFMTFSIIKNAIIKELSENYTDFYIQNAGSWTVITATKFK